MFEYKNRPLSRAANVRVVQGVSPAVLGHYKVTVDSGGWLYFSDRYEWEKEDPKDW